MVRTLFRHKWWFAVATALVVILSLWRPTSTTFAVAEDEGQKPAKARSRNGAAPTEQEKTSAARVAVVRPQSGGIARSSEQPGTMESFDFADLYAKVSGYLKSQSVDIGSKVSAGDVLIEIDAPEFEEALNEATAAVAQAQAQVVQMEARVKTARAEVEAAQANITLAEAELAKATSYLSFREIQFNRVKQLFDLKSVDERLVDEKHEQRDSAQAAENSAHAAIVAAKSQVTAARARVDSAEADVVDAQAKVRLAKAKESRAKVFVNYTRITSPYDGVVTRRSFHVGDFIRTAEQGGNVPLLTVARTDLMRVIVQVPERYLPYVDVGDPATVVPDGPRDDIVHGKVERISHQEDRVTRTMRVEIDVPNPKKKFRDGMFCRVTIDVDAGTGGLRVPSSSVFVGRQTGKHEVFIVKDGKAHRRVVEIGQDDGKMTEIVSGLAPQDLVVRRPTAELADDVPVEINDAGDPQKPSNSGNGNR